MRPANLACRQSEKKRRGIMSRNAPNLYLILLICGSGCLMVAYENKRTNTTSISEETTNLNGSGDSASDVDMVVSIARNFR